MPESEAKSFELGLRVGELRRYIMEQDWIVAYDALDLLILYLQDHFSITPTPSGTLLKLRESFNERDIAKSAGLMDAVTAKFRQFVGEPTYAKVKGV